MGIAFKSEKDIAGELAPAQFTDHHPTDSQIMDPNDAEVTSCLSSDLQSQSLDDKQTSDPNSVQNQSDVGNSGQEKVIKKPDKILPCPRCNSMDTKFCYYNNYNINQPRHFCKSCQRYWTAGGTMRNVPVGAGRRKSKSASQQHRQLNSSCVAPSAGSNVPDSTSKHVLNCGVSSFMHAKGNGAGKLSKDAIFCESEVRTVIPEEHRGKEDMASKDCEENGEDPNCACVNFSKFTEENTPDEGNEAAPNVSLPSCNGLAPMHPLQCYPGPPWSCPWNPGWNNLAAMAASGRCGLELAHGQENGSVHPFSWNPPPIVAAPPFCAPTVPLPFMPASFWGCMPSWPNGAWGMPWVGSPGSLTATSTGNAGCSSNNSPLGKHSRDMAPGTEDKRENSVWVPKTLRIDDPDEAAKSSIWATLGIKPGKKEPSANGGIFKGFQTQNGENNQQSDATHVLHANPAAFCRSQTFQESS